MRTPGLVTLLALTALGPAEARAQDYAPGEALEARVWLDRGDQPLLQRGDRVRLYYRTSTDAYLTIFHIDTDGSVQLLFPRSPDDDDFVRGGSDYRLLFPTSPYWYVDEYPGQGYFFVIASPERFDYGQFAYSRYDRAWDLSAVGRNVYEDPYVAMDDYVAALLPDWETIPYALDFVSYDVGETHDYPRFLCYDCHGFQSYTAWNPYTYACSTFRVVVWDDPYFYPRYRYRGTRVVYATPRVGVPRFEFTRRSPGEAWSTVRRTRQPPLRRVEYAEPSIVQPPRGEWVPPRRRTVPTEELRSGTRDGRGTSRTIVPGTTTGRPVTSGGASATRPDGARSTTGDPGSGTRVVRPPASGRGSVGTPPRDERPILLRRSPPSRGSARPSTSGSGARSPAARPSSGATGGTRVVRPPVRSGGGSGRSPARPSARPGSGIRPGSGVPPGRPAARPPARRPGEPAARPPARKPGGAAARPARPKPKTGGGARRSGGGND